jgi:hypothetical protein
VGKFGYTINVPGFLFGAPSANMPELKFTWQNSNKEEIMQQSIHPEPGTLCLKANAGNP